MIQSEAISILLKYASQEEITQYIADTMKSGENYFEDFTEESLITDFKARKLSA